MRNVNIETVHERMNELGQRIATGRISLREEFELACLRELLERLKRENTTSDVDAIALNIAHEIMQVVNRRSELIGQEAQLLARIQNWVHIACRASMQQGPRG
ncbi:hypothetical protein [Trabulsiella odontotermitis]|uniref:Uncharacterized protein n=1 Tax=Trabulsiella odontotermitis TaxID=379893 RepID=A0A0L0GLZ5_9ENTR|nr:hypothetical protein [Trabulsiella odontotermitis]KNC89423.1 hypothetical protein GM31_07495 [Trabulsiella odontotermitis]